MSWVLASFLLLGLALAAGFGWYERAHPSARVLALVATLAAAGLAPLADRHPRDISGGERQRLALAIALEGDRPAVVCLDEPTRGMDRASKEKLAARLRELGAAVIVATHDAEFAAAFADRTVLLGDGRPVADAPTAEVLGGGWYFATQTARVLGQGALTPEQGAALLDVPREAVAR